MVPQADQLTTAAAKRLRSTRSYQTLPAPRPWLGQLDDALVELAKAVEARAYYVMYWKVDPDRDPLRSDPRFQALMKQVGLDQ